MFKRDRAEKRHNMKKPKKAPSDRKSEQEVRKSFLAPSRFSAAYWANRVFRPKFSNGKSEKVTEATEYYVQIQVARKRGKIALQTATKDEAARRAARLYEAIRRKGWEQALAEFAPDKARSNGVPTIGEFIAAVEEVATQNPKTIRGYAVSLRWIAARAFKVRSDRERFDHRTGGNAKWKAKIDRISIADLTPRKVENALAKFIAEAGASPLAQDRAKRSAASIARQARAMFSPKLTRKLDFDSIPNPFDGVHVESARVTRYHGTIDAAALFQDARKELSGSDPEAYKVLLLALGAGLRRLEIDTLTWPQVDAEKALIRIETTEHFRTKTRDSEGTVFVDPGLIAELETFRKSATGLFVLESPLEPRPNSNVARYRANATFKRLNTWLRSKGVMGHKPIHTLRKEFGSLIAGSADIHTASRQLRHASIHVSAAYYVDHRKKTVVPVGEFLQNTRSKSGKKAK